VYLTYVGNNNYFYVRGLMNATKFDGLGIGGHHGGKNGSHPKFNSNQPDVHLIY
jgi:hypothetical protein